MKFDYVFYLNEEKDEQGRNVGFFGYEDGHKLVEAYRGSVEGDNEGEVLDSLFEIFNIHHPKDYRNRSMSVGDVVRVNGKFFAVASIGFEEIKIPATA